MNTIKFSKIGNKTTEQHNLEIIDVKETKLFESEIKLYQPCNLNLFITNKCQNKCDFCINKSNICSEDVDDETYFTSLREVLFGLQNQNIEITITGGEPTLNPKRLVKTMEICKEFGLPCRTFSTTGYGLISLYDNKPVCQHMIENGFIHNINISRMHMDEIENTSVFQGNNISNEYISKLAMFFKLNHAEMRLSCNLIQGKIDSIEKMLAFVDYYEKLGVETIMFRELVGIKDVLLSNILDFSLFTYIETLEGLCYNVVVMKYKDFLVKYYDTRTSIDKNIVTTLSLKNGVLRKGFGGDILWQLK